MIERAALLANTVSARAATEKLSHTKTFELLFLYKVILPGDLSLCIRNLHAMGPFHYWQRPRSVSSPLNGSSGCVENGRVAFHYWQLSRSVSSPLDSLTGRAENGKVVSLAACTPGRLLGSILDVLRHGFTRRQAYPINVG